MKIDEMIENIMSSKDDDLIVEMIRRGNLRKRLIEIEGRRFDDRKNET